MNELEEFASAFINLVRDKAIRECDSKLQPKAETVITKRWKSALSFKNPEDIIRLLIPDIVDGTLACLLRALDLGQIELTFKCHSGTTFNLTNDGAGELVGWYMGGEDGWITSFSKERFNNNW